MSKIKDNAVKTIPNYTYSRELTKEEIDEQKDVLTQSLFELEKHEDELKDAKEKFKIAAAPVKEQIKDALTKIKTKHETLTEEVFLIPDYSENVMEYYNSEGELINSRPLMQDEKQLSIKMAVNE